MRRAAILVLLLVAPALAAPARFFLAGNGTLVVESAHGGTPETIRYRRADGTYDGAALARVNRVFRSRDGKEGDVSLRLVELLGYLQRTTGTTPLVVASGYRSPGYNEALRAQGRKAAGGSLHTEGLAADLVFSRRQLEPLWHRLRDLECCGTGLYLESGFLHVDVGQPRFWTATTSRVDENLSAGNARLFARTEFDRYQAGEAIAVTLHALTVPPAEIARTAELVPEHGDPVAVAIDGAGECVRVPDHTTLLRVTGASGKGRARLRLRTCEPRVERTPAVLETNAIDVD